MLNACCLCWRVGHWLLLTTFKLAWKIATIWALVSAKCCSNLTLLCIYNQHLFLVSCCFFHSHVLWQDGLTSYIHPQIWIESHSNVKLCPVFILKDYLKDTEPFRKEPDVSCVTSVLDKKRQHRLVCAKTISSWVREVLCVAKTCLYVLTRGL